MNRRDFKLIFFCGGLSLLALSLLFGASRPTKSSYRPAESTAAVNAPINLSSRAAQKNLSRYPPFKR